MIGATVITKLSTVEEKHILLEMPEDVARSLHAVLQHIGGCPEESRRRHMDELIIVLEEKGITSPGVGEGQWIVGDHFRSGM